MSSFRKNHDFPVNEKVPQHLKFLSMNILSLQYQFVTKQTSYM